ncbi:MAG: glycosyltransferase family 4 protein [Motilibacteraceae bacterium]
MTTSNERRVLHLVTRDQRRGAELSAVSISEALSELGWRSEVVALAPGPAERALGVRVLGQSTLSVRTLLRLRQALRRADVVVAHGSRALPASVLAGPGLGVPVVYANIGDPGYWASSRWRTIRTRLLLSRTAAVAAKSALALPVFDAKYRVPPQRLAVVGTGRPTDQLTPLTREERDSARSRHGLPTDAPLAVVVGALAPEKRVDVALDAVASLPDVHLAVVGDGPLRAALEAHAAEHVARIHFLGRLEDPVPVMGAADVVLLTSESEGTPGVLIEAGLLGVPSVATDVGFTRDIVADGRTGQLVAADDPAATSRAIVSVLDMPDMGRAARLWCQERFDIRAAAVRWDELLRAVSSSRDGHDQSR